MLKYPGVFLFIFVSLFIGLSFAVFAAPEEGTIDSTNKYSWSENGGWMNWGTSEGGVTVTSSTLSGYIWSENFGWISLNCSNTDSCATVDYKISNNGRSNLSGYAYGENIGWISFRGTNPDYGVDIDAATGEFTGHAYGENVGWIVFNCSTTNSCETVDYKVKTDWRPHCYDGLDNDGDSKVDYPDDPGCVGYGDINESNSGGQGGGVAAGAGSSYGTLSKEEERYPEGPTGGFDMVINNGKATTVYSQVILKLIGSKDVDYVSLAHTPEFKEGLYVKYNSSSPATYVSFVLSEEGLKTVYVKFCSQYGRCSNTISKSILFNPSLPLKGGASAISSYGGDVAEPEIHKPDAKSFPGIEFKGPSDSPPPFLRPSETMPYVGSEPGYFDVISREINKITDSFKDIASTTRERTMFIVNYAKSFIKLLIERIKEAIIYIFDGFDAARRLSQIKLSVVVEDKAEDITAFAQNTYINMQRNKKIDSLKEVFHDASYKMSEAFYESIEEVQRLLTNIYIKSIR
ncbi:MAG: hypothetical protein A3A04_00370 [Candidatus Harrisonbacteria bacterium RIFCSPLOWO2_01_FULL_40_28]|uniref:DUF5667 domain-containing protein n=1 Tax=Candidatus Harrisonbacteria bacterium RIFCSPLOWO2_01_FULL_40_28 TaxID=1798406 RepID=A0A1G1ZMI3_9BACT|nr:MAG: hypothetical protein A3A04_00370 [Candidatus Harrisonbacteria bacterium RIFCSPLOWO2_01_FULL_40_28]